MEKLIIEATSDTPFISFCSSGEMKISGKSIPVDAGTFWEPIQSWFKDYLREPAAKTIFQFQLECLNVSSSKEVLHLLYQLNNLKEKGLISEVEWFYHACDEDMKEVGRDYEHIVRVPFKFKKLEGELV
jgi:hypothetical protein